MIRAMIPVTVHLFFFREDQVLLLRRFNTDYRDGEYSVPAGHLDGGETVMSAAAREAQEEVGLHLQADDMVFSSVMHRIEVMSVSISSYMCANGWANHSTPNLISVMNCVG